VEKGKWDLNEGYVMDHKVSLGRISNALLSRICENACDLLCKQFIFLKKRVFLRISRKYIL